MSSDPSDFSNRWVAALESNIFPCQNSQAEHKKDLEDRKS